MRGINEFLTEHWVIIYGGFMFLLGYIKGWLNCKKEKRKE